MSFIGSVVALDLIVERVGPVWQALSLLYLLIIVGVPAHAIVRGARSRDKVRVTRHAALFLLADNLLALPFILGAMAM